MSQSCCQKTLRFSNVISSKASELSGFRSPEKVS